MAKRLEIRLYEENSEFVTLTSMSPSALDSFLIVMNALKEMATSSITNESISFSIEEGSALGAVHGSDALMEMLYKDIDTAILGESDNKKFTTQLRIIQNQLKRENFSYQFTYFNNDIKKELHDTLKKRSRITVKRKDRSPIEYKLRIINGFFNQIGGKDPNYHFDYGDGVKMTIDCSIEDAKDINQHLYSNVDSLLLSKEWHDEDKKDELTHKVILSKDLVNPLKQFLNHYNKEKDLVEKLTIVHDFIFEQFEKNINKFDLLRVLLLGFNDIRFHLSELKTMLVISKPFKDHQKIKLPRERLYETYSKKKNS